MDVTSAPMFTVDNVFIPAKGETLFVKLIFLPKYSVFNGQDENGIEENEAPHDEEKEVSKDNATTPSSIFTVVKL